MAQGIKRTKKLPRVRLWVYSNSADKSIGPEETSVYGALGCFKEKSSRQLLEEDLNLPLEKLQKKKKRIRKKKEKILNETSGRGHGAVLDQNTFIFVIEDLPRLSTLQLCLPQYLSHLQQSLRRAQANRGFFLPEIITEKDKSVVNLLDSAFELYEEMQNSKIPGEDARYILPLSTRTNIQTLGDARELMHLHSMSNREGVPEIVKYVVNEMIKKAKKVAPLLMEKRETNYEILAWYPSSQLFAKQNKSLDELIEKEGKEGVVMTEYSNFRLDEKAVKKAVRQRDEAELANLKHLHYTFLVPMSLSCFHQATRQRTWDQSVESIYSAIKRGKIVIPPKIQETTYLRDFKELSLSMIEKYKSLVKKGIPEEEALAVIPHALQVYDLIHVNGWNAIHSIGKRTCTEAQWEIRTIAQQMSGLISSVNPVLGDYSKPQGIIYGRCPERKSCGKCFKK